MTREVEPLVFDWHKESEGFLKWLVPTVISDIALGGGLDELSAATDKFTNVVLSMQINGIEVSAGRFLEGVVRNMDVSVEREARRIVEEKLELPDLDDAIAEFRRATRESAIRAFAAVGWDYNPEGH